MKAAKEYLTQLPYGIIGVKGENAQKFLQGQLTCDVTEVTSHKASLSAICNPQGRVIATLYLVQYKGEYFFILPITMVEKLINHLNKYAIFSKVTLHDVTQDFVCTGLYTDSQPQTDDAQLPSTIYHTITSTNTLIVRVGQSVNRFIVLTESVSILDKTAKIREDEMYWKKLAILDGLAMIYPETSLMFTPHMLNYSQLGAVSYKKGCYVGQEIIARTHYIGKSKRHLYRGILKTDNPSSPQIGDLLYQDAVEGGTVIEINPIDKNQYLFLAVIQDHVDIEKLVPFSNKESTLSDLVRLSN